MTETNLTTIPGYAIVEILKEDKERRFFKEITNATGEKHILTIDIPQSGLYDEHFSQGVSIAKVIAIAEGLDTVKPGDMVIVDYSVDTDQASVISNDGNRIVRANAINEFYTDGKLISATTNSRYDVYEYKAGDLKSAATIFGVINGNEIIPNYPYVFLKYVNLEGEFEITEAGLTVPSSEGDMVIRQVMFAHEKSPMRPGDNVLVDFASLYEREVGHELISICMQEDIVAKLN